MNNIIDINDLSFSYNNHKIFKDVNLSIDKGDFVVIIGPNGTGKSTLVKLLLNELPSKQGSIKILNQDIQHFKQWDKIGYIAQNSTSLANGFPATVQEIVQANLYSQIGLFKFYKKQHIELSKKALQEVDMLDYSNKMISDLSGGQQQRVMLARVLVSNPELMILDEPTNAIDSKTIKSLYNLLSRLNKENNLTIVLITHDVEPVLNLANKFYCLEKGSLINLSKEDVVNEQNAKHYHHSHLEEEV